MTAYLINHMREPGKVNPEVLEYLDLVQATLDPFGGKFLVQGANVQALEGAWVGSAIVVSFPDTTQAKNWYKSEAYQDILRLRTDHVVSDIILVDGVARDHTPGKYAAQLKQMNSSAR